MKNAAYSKHASAQSNPKGIPKVKPAPYTPPARTLAVCSKCWCIKGRGIPHVCTKGQKQANISELAKSSSAKTRGRVTSNILKDLCADGGVSLRGGDINLPTATKSLVVKVGKSKVTPKQPKFSHENLKRLQVANNFSDKAVK